MKIDLRTDSPKEDLVICKRKMASLSIARLFVFLALGATFIIGVTEIRPILLLFVPLSALFIYLIILYNAQKDRAAFLNSLLEMEKESSFRQERVLDSLDQGNEFMDKNHPYCNDLDLFGSHSLFQLINHTVNKGGRNLLAQWMKAATEPVLAEKRFSAIKELAGKNLFVRNFEAIGRSFLKEEKTKSQFYSWLEEPIAWKSWYWLPMILGPVGGISLLSAWLFTGINGNLISLWILIGIPLLGLIFKPLLQAAKSMPNEGDLKTYALWTSEIEKLNFHHPYNKSLQAPFVQEDYKASEALKFLEQRSFMIQNRINLMYLIFNLLFWVDFWVLFGIEKWKKKYAHQVHNWESNFAEWQVMSSLASFTNEEGISCATSWNSKGTIHVENLKHPLINPSKCIGNDFSLSETQQLSLLTGSNMSGKTTFMRTLGINMVLANLGLSPFAEKFECSSFQLFTSMRNSDNLGESVSSFYAELARIKNLLDRVENQEPILFLLDEILKGTNTVDRIMGSEALIRQLVKTPSKGIISTHDIELAELSDKINGLVNFSFHSEIKDKEILFDYKIKKGPCPSFNAHKLMELMGIRFETFT